MPEQLELESKSEVKEQPQTPKETADKLYPETENKEVEAKASQETAVIIEPEENKEEVKSEEKKDEKSIVPEKYDLKLPEGSKLDTAWIEKISLEAKAKGFSQDQAQKYLEDRSAVAGEYYNGLIANYQKEKESWVSLVQADPDIGGEKFKETIAYAEKAFKTFGSPKLTAILNETGYGNHPELVRWAAKVGRAMKQDSAVSGSPKGPAPKTPAQKLYGDTHPEKET